MITKYFEIAFNPLNCFGLRCYAKTRSFAHAVAIRDSIKLVHPTFQFIIIEHYV